MDWDALGRVAAEGADVGAHSRSHPRFAGLSDAQLTDEVGGSSDDLHARLGAAPRSFCYPFGDVDDAAVRAVEARFETACTTALRVLGRAEHPLRMPRLDAYYLQAEGRLEGFGSGRFRRYLAVRALLRDLRARLAPNPRPYGSGQGGGAGRTMDTMAARSAG
jgi:peptidoglycan/xylan/chitin deacetylase (PgdA/CDA1 family)